MKAMHPDGVYSYESPDKILRLIGYLQHHKLESSDIGICIDTAHIHCGGQKIITHDDASSYLHAFVTCKVEDDAKYCTVNPYIAMIHLNGNQTYTAKDTHAVPFAKNDLIWHKVPYENSGCRTFVAFAASYDIPIIMEPHGGESELPDIYNALHTFQKTIEHVRKHHVLEGGSLVFRKPPVQYVKDPMPITESVVTSDGSGGTAGAAVGTDTATGVVGDGVKAADPTPTAK